MKKVRQSWYPLGGAVTVAVVADHPRAGGGQRGPWEDPAGAYTRAVIREQGRPGSIENPISVPLKRQRFSQYQDAAPRLPVAEAARQPNHRRRGGVTSADRQAGRRRPQVGTVLRWCAVLALSRGRLG
jgi:hypothetical protein